jgi:hypothetical protein
VSFERQISLMVMFWVGVMGFALFASEWKSWPLRKRALAVAWLVFWLGPPLYFIWTKGVLG